jgi:nucleoside-diphosphate-sugar epimerase
VRRLFSNSARAADVLGWKPEVSLREGIERLLAWHGEQGTDWAEALREDVPLNWQPQN